jgi:hypothetical protein
MPVVPHPQNLFSITAATHQKKIVRMHIAHIVNPHPRTAVRPLTALWRQQVEHTRRSLLVRRVEARARDGAHA